MSTYSRKASFRINTPHKRRNVAAEDEGEGGDGFKKLYSQQPGASSSSRRRKKRKEEKSVTKLADPSFYNPKKTASIYRAVHFGEEGEEGEEGKEGKEVDDSGHLALKGAQYLSLHDPLRYPYDDAFEMVREDIVDDIEREKQRQRAVREKVAEMHHRPTCLDDDSDRNRSSSASYSSALSKEARRKVGYGVRGTNKNRNCSGSAEAKRGIDMEPEPGPEPEPEPGPTMKLANTPASPGNKSSEPRNKGNKGNKGGSSVNIHKSPFSRDRSSVQRRGSEDVDTDSEEDIVSTYKKLGDVVREKTDGKIDPVFPSMPEEGRRFVSSKKPRRRRKIAKSSRGRKRDGIDMEDTPSDRVVMTEDLWKVVSDYEDMRVFSALERDTPDLMKQNMGKKIKNLNTTIVSPLTVLDNIYVQSSRTPEEIAIISQANEWDAIQERMKVGKSAGIRHESFVDRVSPQRDQDHSTRLFEAEKAEKEEIGRTDQDGDEYGDVLPVCDGGIVAEKEAEEIKEEGSTCPTLDILETAKRIYLEEGEEGEQGEDLGHVSTESCVEKDSARGTSTPALSIQENMSALTRKLIRKEKEAKKIVSDARMVGFDIMMKGSVLEALMFFWLEAIQMRPGEEIAKTGPKGKMCTVKSGVLTWNEQGIFSLASQLVSLHEQRDIYRTHIKGLNVKEILEQNPSFGEPCDMNHDDSFLRPAVGSERPCRFGIECFLYSIGQSTVFPDTLNRVVNETAFPGREFYRPEEVRLYQNRRWPKRRRSCLICYEMAMMYIFLYYRRDNRDPPFVIQNHWNKIEGENAYSHARMYPLEDNEKRWTGFVLPKVMRCPTSLRASKTIVKVNGELKKVPCYVQASQNFR